MEGEFVKAALSLLQKTGCMDLVRQEALPALRPARKAAQGVAAAVMACSPLRAEARPGQVRKQGRGGGRSSPVKQGRMVSRPAGPGVPRFFVAGDLDFAGTPDLSCQGEIRGWGEPGERGAARSPWPEEQAEPRAAGRSSSPGWTARKRLAAATPGERCGGRGVAPASAAASWEQRPCPSGVQTGVNKRRTVRTTAGELPRRAQDWIMMRPA
ncbi:hypothetical protein NDU88_010150 [Pleurodeles waltl]|uniref:Uncharacterized protein n=1 Tax=Pleurodeles waltl TaxID=8319 RepID=A0AAV7S2F3_PLEWA|nr:hypothetical protein NDU88_010150 [Pleurodeles waltl]